MIIKAIIFQVLEKHGRYYNISANTVKNDCLGITKRTETFKGRKRPATFHF